MADTTAQATAIGMPSLRAATTMLLFALGLCSGRRAASTTGLSSARSSSAGPAPTTRVAAALPSSPARPTAAPTKQNTSSGSSVRDGFKPGAKWQIAIQDPVDPRGGWKPADASVIDVDLFHASKDPTLIPGLHAAGRTVLCYFNAGAVQVTDCDWPEWHARGLFGGKTVANYAQERYVDVTSDAVMSLHHARIDLAASIGCDGVDPDNIDTYDLPPNKSIGKQISQDDMVAFVTRLAAHAHATTTALGRPLMIGQKNAAALTARLHPVLDFAVAENCVGSPRAGSNRGAAGAFCTVLQAAYAAAGKPVLDIEYPVSLAAGARAAGCSAGASARDLDAFCRGGGAAAAGISRVLKLDNDKFGLNGCTQYCAEATSFVLPTYESNATNSCCFGPTC